MNDLNFQSEALTQAARATLSLNGVIVPGVHASQTLTSDATNPSNDETLTIGANTYTFKDTLTGAANEIKIGASASVTLDNIKAAVNAGAGAGTTYGTGTTANASVRAHTKTATTILFVAKTPGVASNTVATTETSAHLSFGAATLEGGVDGDTVTVGSRVYTFVTALSEATGAAAVADQVLYGGDEETAIENLQLAIDATGVAATNYSTGTVEHDDVVAAEPTVLDGPTPAEATLTITAADVGAAGNSIAVATTIADAEWSGSTLEGGADETYTDVLEMTGGVNVEEVDVVISVSEISDGAGLVVTPQVSIDKINWINRTASSSITTVSNTELHVTEPLAYMRFKLVMTGDDPTVALSIKAQPSN